MAALCAIVWLLAQETPSEFPRTPLKPAVVEAKAKDRLIVVEFWTMKAEPSRSYRQKTLGAAPVLAWLGLYGVGARVNVEFNKKLCTQLEVVETPTVLVLDADLARWTRIEGEKKTEEIAAELEAARTARTAFLQAEATLKTAPDDPAALRARAGGFIRREDGPEAEKTLQHLAEVDAGRQGCEDLALRLGNLYYRQRRDKEAVRVLLLAADWARSGNKEVRPQAIVALAALELRADRPDKAVEALELLLKESNRFPDRSKALFILGETYLNKLKDRTRAREVLLRLRDNYSDRFAEAATSLLHYMELQDKGVIGTDDAAPKDAK